MQSESDMTLKFDGTTKRCGHLVEVEVSSQKGDTYLLALQAQSGATASDYVDTIKNSVSSVGVKMNQVKNTMSDRYWKINYS